MTVDVDLTGVTTPQELHERVRQALPVPCWYGNNLDALYDVLSERPELSVRFLCAAQLRAAAPRYAAALERLCGDLSAAAPGRRCTLENGDGTAESPHSNAAATPATSEENAL